MPATRLPILMYHKVGPVVAGSHVAGHYVSRAAFERQMQWLRALKFTSVDLAPYDAVFSVNRPIAITFDDGYRNNLTYASPAMQATGFFGIVYLVSERLGATNHWDDGLEPLMSVDEVQAWLAAGNRIGCHSATHAHLADIAENQLSDEVNGAKDQLQELFGRCVKTFCYPYGQSNATVKRVVQTAGFEAACGTRKGSNRAESDQFDLRRINVRADTWGPLFLLKLLRAYRNAA